MKYTSFFVIVIFMLITSISCMKAISTTSGVVGKENIPEHKCCHNGQCCGTAGCCDDKGCKSAKCPAIKSSKKKKNPKEKLLFLN